MPARAIKLLGSGTVAEDLRVHPMSWRIPRSISEYVFFATLRAIAGVITAPGYVVKSTCDRLEPDANVAGAYMRTRLPPLAATALAPLKNTLLPVKSAGLPIKSPPAAKNGSPEHSPEMNPEPNVVRDRHCSGDWYRRHLSGSGSPARASLREELL